LQCGCPLPLSCLSPIIVAGLSALTRAAFTSIVGLGTRPQAKVVPAALPLYKTENQSMEGGKMLKWAAIFLVIAIIAALFGFTGIAGAAADIARFLFFLFIAIFVIIFLLAIFTGKKMF
jgi:uncharacterized membrane protein YtjA (UPF0391 family)